jgi:uncharacterized membrane protein
MSNYEDSMIISLLNFPMAGFLIAISYLFRGMKDSEPNNYFGIRTKLTRSNKAAWNYVHNEAARPTLLVGIASMAQVLIGVIFASILSWEIILTAQLLTIVVFLVAIFRINKRAEKIFSAEQNG